MSQVADALKDFRVSGGRLPRDEQDVLWPLRIAFQGLGNYLDCFADALALYDAAVLIAHDDLMGSRQKRFQSIAVRDGVLTIYHIGRTMEGVKSGLSRTPVLRGKVCRQKLRHAAGIYNKAFPHFEAVRDAVAHDSEVFANKETYDKHAFRGATTVKLIRGRRLTRSWKGKLVTFELNEDALCALTQSCSEFMAAFEMVDSFAFPATLP